MSKQSKMLTLHEAADRLGVHYMTVYRYVRTGRLDGVKDGAEWRVRTADVDALAADGNARAAAGRSSATRPRGGRSYVRRFVDRLVAGDEAGAWAVVEGALASGLEPESVYLEILVPALQAVGDKWEAGEVSVAQEHQASAVTLRVLGRLSPLLTRRGRKKGSIVLGAPAHDQHGVPVAILTDLLRGRGFRVYDLGDDVPPASFVEVARQAERLLAVGIGATTRDNDEVIAETVAALHDAVDEPVVVGGQAITDEAHAARLGADGYARTGPDALRLFDELRGGRTTAG